MEYLHSQVTKEVSTDSDVGYTERTKDTENEHGEKFHGRFLNVASLKSRTTSVHRLQKGRTSHGLSVRSPCSSPLNLPGISHLSASHLRITNYRRTRTAGTPASRSFPPLPSSARHSNASRFSTTVHPNETIFSFLTISPVFFSFFSSPTFDSFVP